MRFLSVLLASLLLAAWGFGQVQSHSKLHQNERAQQSNLEAASRGKGFTNINYLGWPKPMGDLPNTGLSSYGGSNGQLRWKTYLGAPGTTSSAAIFIFGYTETLTVGSLDSNIYMISTDGSISSKIPTGGPIYASPSINGTSTASIASSDGNIYTYSTFGSSQPPYSSIGAVKATINYTNSLVYGSLDHNFYGWYSSPAVQWKITTGGPITACAAVTGTPAYLQKIYFGSEDGKVYSCDATGALSWTTNLGSPIDTSPVVGWQNQVYVTCSDGKLYCLDCDTGTIKWSFATGGKIDTSPVCDGNDTLYFGSEDGNFYALSPQSGLPYWHYHADSQIKSSAVLGSDGVLYFGSESGKLYALTTQEELKWTYQAGAAIESSPAIGRNGTVYFTATDGYLYAVGTQNLIGAIDSAVLDTDNALPGHVHTVTITLKAPAPSGGTLVSTFGGWQTDYSMPSCAYIPEGQMSTTIPLLDASTTWIGGSLQIWNDTNSVFLDFGKESPISNQWAQDKQGSLNTAQSLGSGSDGQLKWKFMTTGPIVSTPGIRSDGSIYLASNDGRVYRINHTGKLIYSSQIAGTLSTPVFSTISGFTTVRSHEGYLYLLEQSLGRRFKISLTPDSSSSSPLIDAVGKWAPYFSAGNTVYSADTDTGTTVAAYVTFGHIEATPAMDSNGRMYIPSDDGHVYCGKASTSLVWSFTPDSLVKTSPSLDQNGNVYFTSSLGTIYCLNSSGVLQWTQILPGGANTAVAIDSNGSLLVGTASGQICSLTMTGVLKWTFNTGGKIINDLALDSKGVVYANSADGLLYAINPDGSKRWTYLSGTTNTSPSIADDGVLYIGGADGYLRAIGSASTNETVASISLNPNYVIGGQTGTATVTLANPAPANGATIFLAGSNPNKAVISVPYSMFIAPGQTTGTFKFSTVVVNDIYPVELYAYTDSSVVSQNIAVATGQFTLAFSPNSVTGGQSATGTVTLSQPAPQAGILVNLSSPSPYVTVPASVTVAQGLTTATFSVKTQPVITSTQATITAVDNPIQFTGTITIVPPTVSKVTVSPTSVAGGTTSTGTVTLTGLAPTGGYTVKLGSDNSAGSVPSNITIPANSQSSTFTVQTTPVSSTVIANISASDSSTNVSTQLSINPPSVNNISLSPNTVVGGNSCTGTITLDGPAASSGTVVSLSSSAQYASVPSTVTVPSGATTATFTVTTTGVASKVSLSIKAQAGVGNVSAQLTINPATLQSLVLNPTSIAGGSQSTGTVALTGLAPNGGLSISLSSNLSIASVPSSITVPSGSSSANFQVSTVGVSTSTAVTISASSSGVLLHATLTVIPATQVSLSFSPSAVLGGLNSTGTVKLNGTAPNTGYIINLTTSDPSVKIPAAVNIPTGQSSVAFVTGTSPVDTPLSVTVTGTAGGTSVSGTLTVNPAAVSSVVLSPTSVQGGSPTTGTVTLNANAGPSGVTVTLSSNTSSAVPPATVQVPAGTNSTTFTVNTLAVQAQTSATITAVANGGSASTTLTINGDNLTGLSLNPTTVVGGNNCVGTVTLSGPAPAGGTVVSLGITAGPATVPNTVTVPAGSSSATFNIATTPVNASSTSTVTATLGTTNQTATLTVAPMALTGLSLNPTSVAGGNSSTGTVTLNGPAPSSGVSIALNSSLTSAATVPATITVAAGQSSATFTVNTFSTTKQKSATIQASFSGVNLSATAIGTATLDGPAPTGGVVVKLASSTTKAIVPASVTVAVGKTSMTFQVKTLAVASITTANITGTVGSSTQVGTLTINPPTLTSLTLTPTTVIGLTSSTGTLVISGPAPTGGLVVNLSSTQSAAIVPATATIPAGATKGTFTVKTVSVPVVTSASIKATLNAQSQSATLTINPPVITKLALSPASVKGGKTSTGTITLGTAAPTGGITVTLNSSNGVASVPATVTIAGGKTTGTFNVTTTVVTTQTTSNITATLPTSSKSATLTVTK